MLALDLFGYIRNKKTLVMPKLQTSVHKKKKKQIAFTGKKKILISTYLYYFKKEEPKISSKLNLYAEIRSCNLIESEKLIKNTN